VTATANGDQGASGNFYVNVNSTQGFASVVAASPYCAFEFDNVAFNPTAVQFVQAASAVAIQGADDV
jgi:hypothetical protein